jgi:hypothetical protein
VKLLPERRSGCETFTGTAFRPVPALLHPWLNCCVSRTKILRIFIFHMLLWVNK